MRPDWPNQLRPTALTQGGGMTRDQHARAELLQQDGEYRRLAEQHQTLESRLCELLDHPYPSSDDEFEKATLKKKKLQVKDQMEHIFRRHLTPLPGENAPAFES